MRKAYVWTFGSQIWSILQSIWVSIRGAQKELDEARLRFAAAEVLDLKVPLVSYGQT